MNITALHKTVTALPLIAMLALAGCGGGGGGGGTAGSPQTPGGGGSGGGGGTALMPASGLHVGEADPDTGATTLSSALRTDNSANRATIKKDTYIASLSNDGGGGYGSGGFRVTYVIDGQESSVDFDSADFGAGSNSAEYYKQMPNGDQFWLWSFPNTKSWTGDHYTQYGFSNWLPGGVRGYITDGSRTNANNLPSGSATYNAEMYGDLFDNTASNPNSRSSRTTAFGYLTLTANFADGSLGGRIFNLRMRRPGETSFSNISTTSRLDIDNGHLNDKGQFTAELTGVEDDPTIPREDSVDGFEGDMLGEFYGPDAAEVAGVLNAKRVGNGLDQELIGRFGGNKAVGAEAIVAGIHRYIGDRSELLDDDGMARVERTENGWSVTVDGESVTFDDADDYGASPNFPALYARDLGNDESVAFWTRTGGFGGGPRFDHFDVKGWSYVTWSPGVDALTADFSQDGISGSNFYVLHGNRTPAADMPASGTATYMGRMQADDFPTDDGVSSVSADATRYRGDATLTAAFGSSSVSGRLFNLQRRPGNGGNYTDVQDELTFGATISGNRFTASAVRGTQDMAGYQSGSVRGAFFGPAAEEAGGVFNATDITNSRAMVGYFGGDKQ